MDVFKEVFVFRVFLSVIVVVLFFIMIFFFMLGWCLYFFSSVLLNEFVIICCFILFLNILRGWIFDMKVVYNIDNVSFCVVWGVCSLLNLLSLVLRLLGGFGVKGFFVFVKIFFGFEEEWSCFFFFGWFIVIWNIIEIFCLYGEYGWRLFCVVFNCFERNVFLNFIVVFVFMFINVVWLCWCIVMVVFILNNF